MKKGVIFLLLLIVAKIAAGQNLVPNGDFEQVQQCPADTSYLISKYWYNPNAGSSDQFTFLATSWGYCSSFPFPYAVSCINPSANYQGYQLPHEGLGYGGFGGGADNPNDSFANGEYLAVRLTDSLRTNKRYCVSFWINMASTTKYASNAVGISFRVDSISTGWWAPLYSCIPPDVVCPNIISDTLNWILVSDTFLAHGSERYLVIGNLRPPNQTSYLAIDSTNQGPVRSAYYYVDDISVTYCDVPEDTNPPENPLEEITLNPNPGDGEFILKGYFPAESTFEVYDMLGKKVYESSLPSGNSSFPVTLTLANAVYTYRVKNADGISKAGKFIICR